MGRAVSSAAALLLSSLLALLFGTSSVVGQDPTERDALCTQDGCFVVYFQRKTFLDAWRACKDKGGDLATVKHAADADAIRRLFSTLDLRHSRSKVQTWIGLLRQPRQCSSTQPLRGFSWTTGDQDTDYTNWRGEFSPSTCSVPRCVAMGYDTLKQEHNFKWLDGACSVPVEAYLCRYTYKGMCRALWSEGTGHALYNTPFNLLSTLLTHVPLESVATVPCPGGSDQEQSVVCVLKEDGSVGWSRDPPLCPDRPLPHHWCQQDNGGCQHFCRPAAGHFYCECGEGYELGEDGRSCQASEVCEGAPCEFECLPLSDGFRCACPEGYMLAADGLGCLDVDECLQSPCEQQCLNAPGTFECQCQDGYQADGGGACKDIDECIKTPCEDACENTEGSYMCHCRLGFSLLPEDQTHCQDIDECQIAGTCEQMCVNYEGGFECYCREGYKLLNDNFSCGKIADRSAATTPFDWDPQDYDWNSRQGHTDWNSRQGHTDWPSEGGQPLDWLSDHTTVANPDVIWVTTAPQEESQTSRGVEPPTQETNKQGTTDPGDADRVKQTTKLQFWLTTIPSTPLPTISSSTVADWYEEEEEEEETTAPPPHVSTSTISGGAWNWWAGLATTSQKPGHPEDHMTTDSSNPVEELRGGGDYTVVTTPQDTATPTQHISSQPSILEPGQEDREQNQSITWLLVGLLVPISIFIVVMVALAAVYCSRCSVQQRNKNTSDCYHWISGAHDKQGAAQPSAGVKGHV